MMEDRRFTNLTKFAVFKEDVEQIRILRTHLVRQNISDRDWLMAQVHAANEEYGKEGLALTAQEFLDYLEKNYKVLFSRKYLQYFRNNLDWEEGVHFHRRVVGNKTEIVYVADVLGPILGADERAHKRWIKRDEYKKNKIVRDTLKAKPPVENLVESEATIRGYAGHI